MDDLFKALGIGFLSFFVIHASLEPRVRRGAVKQASESFRGGEISAKVEPRGMFGLLANDVWSVDIFGKGVKSGELPFALKPKEGWKGSIRHLRLHLTDFEMGGLPIGRFEGDIPFVKYDIGHAMTRRRLVFRAAETGTATVYLTPENLKFFLTRKFRDTLFDPVVTLSTDRVRISGMYSLLGVRQPFVSTAGVVARDGRYIELADAEFRISDKPLPEAVAQNLLKNINPILDTERDLKLRGYFSLRKVFVGEKYVRIEGALKLPVLPTTLQER